MKAYLVTAFTAIVAVTLSVLGFVFNGVHLSQTQMDTLIVLLIVCGASALYCFVVGELARNNSQMDKLWSVLPIAYVWIVFAKGGFNPRTLIYAIVVTLWGIRLTMNFARKGAYKIKFWEGEEDYRWAILRKNKYFSKRIVWAGFDLLFISIYQNALVLAMTLPCVAIMDSTASFGAFDYIAAITAVLFLLLETVADEQQWKFQQTKKKLLKEEGSLDKLPEPYKYGFNTVGVWGRMRHPNYLGEQAIWLCLYLFTINAGVNTYYIFNWSIFGPMFIILLFMGSSTLGEAISGGKYPLYSEYKKQVFKYLPIRRFKESKID